VAVVASLVDFINTDGEVTGNWSTDQSAVSEQDIALVMARTNCIAHPSVMMRTEIARKYLYQTNQKGAEDWDLWLRLLVDGRRIAKLSEVLLHYRIHLDSITAGDKRKELLEIRLLRVLRKFLAGRLMHLRLNAFFFRVLLGMFRTVGRHLKVNLIPHWARSIKRIMTSSPLRVLLEKRAFEKTLRAYNGRHYFIFPYTHVGGAEKVHADIVAAVKDARPLVIFSGFSQNEKFLERFAVHAEVLVVPNYINYPFTSEKAKQQLADKMNQSDAIVLGSNAGLFYDLIPSLKENVKVIELIHAFKYQPEANLAHKTLLPLAKRIHARLFVSNAALQEFDKFLFHNNIPESLRQRLKFISNAVQLPDRVEQKNASIGVLFVGRNSPEKRLGLFLRIAEQVKQEAKKEIHFTVVGMQQSNSATISYLGEITDEEHLLSIYNQHHILLVTSSREGFPVVIMEAMAAGLVVISTPVGDVPNRLNGANGIVLSSSDPDSTIREASMVILDLLNDPIKMNALGEAARSYAVNNFSFDAFRSAYRLLLELPD
jgi:glycosyltransferase involved in cell wall biosynthesis